MPNQYNNQYIRSTANTDGISFSDIAKQISTHPGHAEIDLSDLSLSDLRSKHYDYVDGQNQIGVNSNLGISNFAESLCWGFALRAWNETQPYGRRYTTYDNAGAELHAWGNSDLNVQDHFSYKTTHDGTSTIWQDSITYGRSEGEWNGGVTKTIKVEPQGTDSDGSYVMNIQVTPELKTSTPSRIVNNVTTNFTGSSPYIPTDWAYIMHPGSDNVDDGYQ